MDFKGLTMSQLIEAYNKLADEKGVAHETEFKNLAAARAAITSLESKMTDGTTAVMADPEAATGAAEGTEGAVSTTDSKYSTVGKRGPTQGVGEFAKQLLAGGMATGDVLTKVREQFPTAKTSASCIAYYKAALKNPNLGKRKGGVASDPTALRAKAAELMAAAQAAEAANAEAAVKAAAEAVAKAEVAKKAAEAALAAQAALKEQQAAAQAPAA
jgi:hypothetical protein